MGQIKNKKMKWKELLIRETITFIERTTATIVGGLIIWKIVIN